MEKEQEVDPALPPAHRHSGSGHASMDNLRKLDYVLPWRLHCLHFGLFQEAKHTTEDAFE